MHTGVSRAVGNNAERLLREEEIVRRRYGGSPPRSRKNSTSETIFNFEFCERLFSVEPDERMPRHV